MKIMFAALAPLLVAACAPVNELEDASLLTAATDPSVSGPAVSGPGVAYAPHILEEPANWRALNDAQGGSGQ
ncbi:hypothetical protein [Amaricoccus macauensis]|uniref:hypothetical protein n=1 Tax=Amaricoccus macauensis TaxID=57001 RepID=UPI003C7A04F5